MKALKAIWSFFGSMMGSYGWLPVLALAALLYGLWFEFERRGERITELEGELETAQTQVTRETNNQGALSGRDERRDLAEDERGKAHAKIDQTQDSVHCARSEPIRAALDSLPDNAAEQ